MPFPRDRLRIMRWSHEMALSIGCAGPASTEKRALPLCLVALKTDTGHWLPPKVARAKVVDCIPRGDRCH
jgi:hypothetical protein